MAFVVLFVLALSSVSLAVPTTNVDQKEPVAPEVVPVAEQAPAAATVNVQSVPEGKVGALNRPILAGTWIIAMAHCLIVIMISSLIRNPGLLLEL